MAGISFLTVNSISDAGREETSLSDDTRSDIEEVDYTQHEWVAEPKHTRVKSRLPSITTLERESAVLQESGAAMMLSKSVCHYFTNMLIGKANWLFICHLLLIPFKGVRSQDGHFEETQWDLWFSNCSK